jgi:hypothetical protein
MEANAGERPRYRIIDDVEPLSERTWAASPHLPLIAAVLCAPFWFAALSAANSRLLGHHRWRRHVLLGAAYVALHWSVAALASTHVPRAGWAYVGLLLTGARFALAYYLGEEQVDVSEMFEQAGGRTLGVGTTIVAVLILGEAVRRLRPAALALVLG